jgi:hypothetical protein
MRHQASRVRLTDAFPQEIRFEDGEAPPKEAVDA